MQRKNEVVFLKEECETMRNDLAYAIGALKEHLVDHYAIYELEKILLQISEKIILKKSYTQVVTEC
jgi:hypothetical protein